MSVYPWCKACYCKLPKCTNPITHKDSRGFRSDFRLGGVHGERIRRLHDKREEAEDYERTTITDFKRGILYPNRKGDKRTFGDACDYFKTTYMIPNQQNQDERYLNIYRDFFGAKTLLTAIDQERCKELFAELASKMQPASVVRRWTLLISIFRENKKWCQVNPAIGVIPKLFRKKADRPKTVYFTDEQYLKLLSVCTNIDDEDVVFIFRNTGFRQGDGETFAVEHCDFTTNTIYVPEQKNQEAGSVPMVPQVRQRIKEIMCRKNITGGRLLNMVNIGRRFRRLVKLAGLYKPYPNNLTLHSLRHSWGTYVQKSYKDIAVTQKLMRQKNIKMTMRYAHAANEALQSAALAGSSPSAPSEQAVDIPTDTPVKKGADHES